MHGTAMRIAWFVAIWCAGVVAVTVLGILVKLVLR
jgi:hypothetical protein